MHEHIVQQGECLAKIALKYGFTQWQTIYNAPENESLRYKRPNPNVLYAGDKIFIPEKATKQDACQTDKRHRFQLKSNKWKLRLEIRDEIGKPLEDVPYELYIGKNLMTKEHTGKNGLIEENVDAAVSSVKLKILGDEIELRIGHLDPITRVKGIQQRLNNLGYNAGAVDGILGPKTRLALMSFQAAQKMKVSGLIDEDTRRALLKVHDNDEVLTPMEEDPEIQDQPPDQPGQDEPAEGGVDLDLAINEEPDLGEEWDALGLPDTMDLGEKSKLIYGAQQRLKALGFYTGSIDGTDGPETQAAVRAFQEFCKDNAGSDDPSIIDSGPIDGMIGPLTKRALETYFGC